MTIEEQIIVAFSKKTVKNRQILDELKRKFAKERRTRMPSNSLLLEAYHSLSKDKRISLNKKIVEVLRIKKIRSLSGIVVVSVLTKPYACPGKCIYCPLQDNAPKSYLDGEPAVMRAIKLNYDPFKQIQARIKSLEATGHPTDKIDLRIIGGTWSFYKKSYQTWFIKKCFQGANRYPKTINKANSLINLQKENEMAKHRIIGITIETRPDFINKEEIKRLRRLGVTRVELGVQTIYNDILKINRRGHKIKATVIATKLLKDAGFKICYQMMPNLLGSSIKRDLEMFQELFQSPDFQPDYLKIYPCALLKEAPLYNVWKKGEYRPYSTKELIQLLIKIKKTVPYYCRIQRIIRDIPSYYIVEGGTKVSNLRQIIADIAKKESWRCKCIRCREIKENYNPKEKIKLFRIDYDASQGKEIFLSFENKDRTHLFSLLRLRIPEKPIFSVLENASIIRELHTYGQLLPVSIKGKAPQHRGLGKKLMKEAEKITKKEFGLKKIAVISGIGVRGYYRKLGYKLKDTYMIKKI